MLQSLLLSSARVQNVFHSFPDHDQHPPRTLETDGVARSGAQEPTIGLNANLVLNNLNALSTDPWWWMHATCGVFAIPALWI
jgi:hypothetical protein